MSYTFYKINYKLPPAGVCYTYCLLFQHHALGSRVYYTLASGIWGNWTNPIVLQRWNIDIPANHTGEIHKKYTMPTRHI